MALRPLEDIWIDANFKETQIADLQIGQSVEIRVMPIRTTYTAAGSPASALVLERPLRLLPPENATGNFVKVVQRLPVRIDLVDGNPSEAPSS